MTQNVLRVWITLARCLYFTRPHLLVGLVATAFNTVPGLPIRSIALGGRPTIVARSRNRGPRRRFSSTMSRLFCQGFHESRWSIFFRAPPENVLVMRDGAYASEMLGASRSIRFASSGCRGSAHELRPARHTEVVGVVPIPLIAPAPTLTCRSEVFRRSTDRFALVSVRAGRFNGYSELNRWKEAPIPSGLNRRLRQYGGGPWNVSAFLTRGEASSLIRKSGADEKI